MWAEFLNEHCQCVDANLEQLLAVLQQEEGPPSASGALPSTSPSSLFAEYPVFIDDQTVRTIEALVSAVFEVTALPQFVEQAMAEAPTIARHGAGTLGILHGFDFHITADGPRLIEINTNAGGALLNLMLSQAQKACCEAAQPLVATPPAEEAVAVAELLVRGFRNEFARARGSEASLRRIAIVDENPTEQFLYSEFRLFAALFQQHGIEAMIVDPSELSHRDARLWAQGQPIDLVYNRLTDFYFEQSDCSALRDGYVSGQVVVTPAPRHHALLANKRHLATLGDTEALRQLGVSTEAMATLAACVPPAEVVKPENRERLYRARKQLFFKPLQGYASKAAYRGDKLTRAKFDEVMANDYLAQQIVAPSQRTVLVDGKPKKLKLDLRAYVVDARVLLFAARLYQGQTTNFRTAGGGFAAVLAIPPHLLHA